MNRIFFDDEAERSFARDGFAVVRLLPKEEAADLLAGLRALRRSHSLDSENRKESGFYVSFLDHDLSYRRAIYHHMRDALEPRLNRIVDDYRVLTGSFLEKPPGGGDVELHCDQTMSADLDDVNLIVWCPLVDVDETNGTLRLVAGSQKLLPHVATFGVPAYFGHCRERLQARSRSFFLAAGEAVIYDSTMPHWSPPNRSDRSRFALNLMCLPADAVPAFYKPCQSPDGPMFELFDMSGEGYYEYDIDDFLAGTVRRKSLGFVSNPNRHLMPEEFDSLMDAAARRRASGGRPALARWAARLRSLVGLPAAQPVRPE